MAGRRPSRLVVAVSVVAIAAALTAMRLWVFPPQRLYAPDETTTGTTGPLGERTYIFVGPFYVKDSDPVYVRDVRLTGVPRGMRIVGVHAVENRSGGYTRAPLDSDQMRPFTDMVLRAGEEHRWGVVVIVESIEPGVWVTSGLDVMWRSGPYRGTTHYKYRVKVTVEPPAPSATPSAARDAVPTFRLPDDPMLSRSGTTHWVSLG